MKESDERPEGTPQITPHYDATKTTGVEAWDQKRRLADAMRLVIERLVPSNAPEAELRARIEGAESVAIMKLGRHFPKVRAVIDSLGLTSHATYVERATLEAEIVRPLSEAPDAAPYFSMILVHALSAGLATAPSSANRGEFRSCDALHSSSGAERRPARQYAQRRP